METHTEAPKPIASGLLAQSRTRGRMIVMRVLALMIVAFLLIATGAWLRGAEFNPVSQLGRPVAFLGVAYLACRGMNWARILLVIWMGLIALTFGVSAIGISAVSAPWSIVTLAMAASAGYGAYVFQANDDVRAFLSDQARQATAGRVA